MKLEQNCIAFFGSKKIACGTLLEVASAVKKFMQKGKNESLLIFAEDTSAQIEIDFRGSVENVLKRLQEAHAEQTEKSGPGRPKLGVVSREISLLPRHWDWLSLQPGGASVTLRKLVEEAKKKNQPQDQIRQAQDATYKFMTVMAGDFPQYEEALRALYAKNKVLFDALIAAWPKDVMAHIQSIAPPAFKRSVSPP